MDEDEEWELRCKIRDVLSQKLLSLSASKLGAGADAVMRLLHDEGIFRTYPAAEIIVSGLVMVHGKAMSIEEIERVVSRG